MLLCALIGLVSCGKPREPVLEPAEWAFGTIPATETVEREIAVENPGRRPVQVSFLSTCDCLAVEPGRLDLAAGDKKRVTLRYDPSEDSGSIEIQVIVRTGRGSEARRQMLRIFGRVRAGGSLEERSGQPESPAPGPQLSFEYFYDPGCRGCETLLARQMIALQQELQIRLRVIRKDIRKPEVHQLYVQKLAALGMEERAFPAVVLSDEVLQGAEEIERGFKKVLQQHLVTLSYYFFPGCRNCERFLSHEIPLLEKQLGIALKVERADIFDPLTYTRYLRLLESLGEQERAYPSIVAGDRVLQGESEIESGLRQVLIALAKWEGAGTGPETQRSAAAGSSHPKGTTDLTVLAVITAGLLDGINPCAFTSLIFLISALAVAGKNRREVLVLGLFYALSVLVTYYFIGLGFLSVIRYAHSFHVVATIIRWALVAVLGVFAALSFYDFLLIRRGKTNEMVLQLPMAMKRRIHVSIKSKTRSAALAGSAVVLGFLVSVFELACTGQVYLPTIVYAVRSGRALRGHAYLLVYNLGFIAPLVVVFALSIAGFSLKSLTAVFQKRMALVKLALAGLFTALAVLTIAM